MSPSLDLATLLPLFSKTTVFLWLFISTLLDYWYPFINRSFFINTLDHIDSQQKILRGFLPSPESGQRNFIYKNLKKFYGFFVESKVPIKFDAKCPSEEKSENCPVFKGLTTFLTNSKYDPDYIKLNITKINDMWNIIRRSCITRNRQVSFIEMLIVQVLSIFLLRMTMKPNGDIIPTIIPFELVFTISLIVLILALAISLLETKPSYFYETKALRLSIICVCWFIIGWYLFVISQ
jgi:hypothetical protein